MLSRKRKDSAKLSRKEKSTNPKTGISSVAQYWQVWDYQ